MGVTHVFPSKNVRIKANRLFAPPYHGRAPLVARLAEVGHVAQTGADGQGGQLAGAALVGEGHAALTVELGLQARVEGHAQGEVAGGAAASNPAMLPESRPSGRLSLWPVRIDNQGFTDYARNAFARQKV